MDNQSQEVYSAMQEGKPLRTYQKTILGKVHIVTLNPFTDQPEAIILAGDDKVEVWTPKAEAFFKRMNAKHFEAGRLIEVARNELSADAKKNPNHITNEEIDTLLNNKFLALKSKLDAMTEEAPIFRLLNRARELDKSEKVIKHIEQRLAEVQGII